MPPPPTPRTWRTSGRSSDGASGQALRREEAETGVDTVVLESRALGHTSSAPVQTRRADLDRPHLLSSMFVSVLFQNPQPQPSDPEPLPARPCL